MLKRWRWRQFSDRIASGIRFRGAVFSVISLFVGFVYPDVTWSTEPAAVETTPTVRGSIATDTVWDGRLVVDDMVTVEAGATLTIKPGAEVRFTTAGGLAVNGVVRAEGTADKPIQFLPAAEGQEPWAGIVLRNASDPSVLRSCRVNGARVIEIGGVNGGEHRIEGCDISGGIVGISVSGAGVRAVVTGNRLTDLSEAGIRCNVKAVPVVADNVLERCGQVGIGAQNGAAPEIRGNRVSGCESGIEIVQAPPRVSGNTVTGCVRGIALSSVSGGEPVQGNRVEANETGILCQQFSAPEITNNTVVKNKDGIVAFRGSKPLIRANDILDNETGIICSQFADALVSANTIARNGRGIFLTLSSFAVIHGNNLEDNKIQVESFRISLAYERQGTDKPLRGRLQQNQAQVERGRAMPLAKKDDGFDPTGRSLDLSGNWWGEATTREMEEKGPNANIVGISDGYDLPLVDDYPQEKIIYTPWAKQRIAATGVPAPAERTGVEGRVVRSGKPLAGLRVHAYLDAAGGFQGEGYASSDPTTEKGLFTLTLPPGSYYLVAKGSLQPAAPSGPDPGEYFGYYGSNPVTVFPGAMTTRTIPAAPHALPVVTPDASRDIMMPLKGVVLSPAGPVEGATIHVYTDASQQFRGPDMFGPQGAVASGTDAQGRFSTELPPGNYFLVASKRKGGATLGQLQIGDMSGFYSGNPLRIVAGTSASVVIQVDEKMKEPPATAVAAGTTTGIRGTIRDPSGAVPSRVFVFVTTDPSFILGSMPTRRSRFLEQDGSYFAEVSEGGTYYVFARSGYGGPPETGDWHGFYGDKEPRPVVVQTGTIAQGIDLVVKKVR